NPGCLAICYLFLNFTASSFDSSTSTFSNTQATNSYRSRNFTSQDHFRELDLDTDNVSCFQRVQVYNAAFNFRQVRQTDFRCDRCCARSEAELRQTTVQWHLATLETATYATARTRVLTFVTTTTGFAEARTDTTTQAFTRLFRAFGRRQSI